MNNFIYLNIIEFVINAKKDNINQSSLLLFSFIYLIMIDMIHHIIFNAADFLISPFTPYENRLYLEFPY